METKGSAVNMSAWQKLIMQHVCKVLFLF